MVKNQHDRLLTIAILAARSVAWFPSLNSLDIERQAATDYHDYCKKYGIKPLPIEVHS